MMQQEQDASREQGLLETLLAPLVDALAPQIEHAVHDDDPFGRDPELVRSALPVFRAIDRYFDVDLRGWKNVPESGPFLLVGNHSGGGQPMDPWPFLLRWIEERGAEAPLYSLTYDLDFSYPMIGPLLRRLGLIPANHENAHHAFASGAPVVVFPGGDYEVFRPWTERNRIAFGGRKGFIRLALSAGVPIVPMTIHGAHESTLVLTRGRELARAAGLDRLNIKVFPFIWSIPFGPTPAFVPTIPLPAKVTMQIDEPITWPELGPEATSDDEVLQRCYDEVTGIMQGTLDALAREDPYPILTRINELRPGRLLARSLRARWS